MVLPLRLKGFYPISQKSKQAYEKNERHFFILDFVNFPDLYYGFQITYSFILEKESISKFKICCIYSKQDKPLALYFCFYIFSTLLTHSVHLFDSCVCEII